METIGLIAAMPQESQALLRCIGGWEKIVLGPFRAARFQLADRACLLLTCGMGLRRAMDGTRALLAAASPRLLVSFGIAGAVNLDLRIGDVVVAGNACLLELGQPGPLLPLASLSQAAREAAARVLQPDGVRLLAGTAVTTRGSQVVAPSLQEMPHPILEMETAGIAQVAAEAGIPLVAIRSISDGPQAPIPFDLEAMLDENDDLRPGRLLMTVLRNPRILFRSGQMMKNSRVAAEHAARAVVAVLGQPSPIASP
jgi:adenosylhomocysteine nucleosidase